MLSNIPLVDTDHPHISRWVNVGQDIPLNSISRSMYLKIQELGISDQTTELEINALTRRADASERNNLLGWDALFWKDNYTYSVGVTEATLRNRSRDIKKSYQLKIYAKSTASQLISIIFPEEKPRYKFKIACRYVLQNSFWKESDKI